MTLDERIDEVLNDQQSNDFLTGQLSTLRDNILEAEKRISKYFISILSFIALSELVRQKIILKITFFSTEIDKLELILIVLPCLISYYCFSLFSQLTLRTSLYDLFVKIVKKNYPKLEEHNLDDFLITHLPNSIETILTRKPRNKIKILINVLSAPFTIFFQWIPLIYSYYLLSKLCGTYDNWIYWLSFAITTAFYLRGALIFIGYFSEQGGFMKLILDVINRIKGQ